MSTLQELASQHATNLDRLYKAAYPDSLLKLQKLQQKLLPNSFLEVRELQRKLYPFQNLLPKIPKPFEDNFAHLKNLEKLSSVMKPAYGLNFEKFFPSNPLSKSFDSFEAIDWNKHFPEIPTNEIEELNNNVKQVQQSEEVSVEEFKKITTAVFSFLYKHKKVIGTALLGQILSMLMFVFIQPYLIKLQKKLGLTEVQTTELVVNNYNEVFKEDVEFAISIKETPLRSFARSTARCILELECGTEVWIEKKNRKWMQVGFYDENDEEKTGWVLINDFKTFDINE